MFEVKNAIILAAGRGTRLGHLTDKTPKPLLAPRGVKFIDAIINNLQEKGINDIYVITGYLHQQFEYLKNQGIKLIHNNDWNKGNNVTSIKAAIEVLGNSLIVNGDIIMKENVFKKEYPYSLTYAEKNENIDEWISVFRENNNIDTFDKKGLGKKGFYQREIIFVTKDLVEGIKKDIKTFDMNEYQEYLMLKTAKRLNLSFKIFEIPKNIVYDLDTIEEYKNYKNNK